MLDPTIQRQLQQALALHQANRFAEAEQIYRQVLARHPNEANALNLLGLLAHQTNRLDLAISLLTQAAQHAPHISAVHIHLASALHAAGQLDKSIEHFQRAAQLEPRNAVFQRHLAIALASAGRVDEAIEHFRTVVSLQPASSEAQYNLGTGFMARGKYKDALPYLQRAAELDPGNAGIHCNLGAAYRAIWKFDQAMTHYQRAIELKPDYPDALYNLGALRHALIDVPGSIECYRKCLAIKPDFQTAQSSLLLALHYVVPFDQRAVYEESIRWWGSKGAPEAPPRARTIDPQRRLKIGYVSADLFLHSVSFFLEPILAHHDRDRFEIFVYSSVTHPDATTKRLVGYVDHWRDVMTLPDDRLAQLIRADEIDILVDLSGHTSHNRMPTFAAKPAPVQVTYLGYPNTTGLRAMDYRIADPVADPPGPDDELYVEKLIRLPRTAWCYRPPADAPDVSPLPALHNGYITFASFNNLAKVNHPLIAIWAKILHAVPTARMLIKSPTLEQDAVRQRLLDGFATHGIASDRLTVAGRIIGYAEHLRTYHQVDLALDTFPYNGTTTTCESLWMGVPVLTRAGDHHVSRVGKSLLTQLDLTELIAESEPMYIERAIELAGNLRRLADLRSTLRDRMQKSSLCDGPAMARDIEAAYSRMWHGFVTRAEVS